MPVSGQGQRGILVVAEAPGEIEDFRGEALLGNAGKEAERLFRAAGLDMRRDCWLTNAVICRPTRFGKNRTPEAKEIEFCRPNLIRTLKELKPRVIITLGKIAMQSLVPLAWKDITIDNIHSWAGWNIPSIKLNAWICPTFHPAHLLRSQDESTTDRVQDPALELWMVRHLLQAARHTKYPWKDKGPDYLSRCRAILDPSKAEPTLAELVERTWGQPLAFDFETSTLKPDGPHARILCCSVSNGEESIAFPWHGKVIGLMKELIRSDIPWIAANVKFEDRWCRRFLGSWVCNWYWDTVTGAHWRNCQTGICSLKFQAFVRLGMDDYSSHLDPYMQAQDSNSPNRLHEVEPRILLSYCALDSLLEVLVARKQMKGWYDA